MTVRVIQLKKNDVRRVALVEEEPHVRLLDDCSSIVSALVTISSLLGET